MVTMKQMQHLARTSHSATEQHEHDERAGTAARPPTN